MTERDIAHRTDKRAIPNQRRSVSLYDALSATAQQTAETAKTVVGTSVPRRVAGFVQELNSVMSILANKWGVDPRTIPVQRAVLRQREQPQNGRVVFVQEHHDREIVAYELTDEDRIKIRRSLPSNLSDMAESLLLMPHVGKAIAALLLNKEITWEVIAGLIGKSKSAIDKGTRGIRPFKRLTIHAICDALEIPEEDDRREVLIRMADEEERQRALRKNGQKNT